MSFFSKIAAAEHTFAAWAEKTLEALFTEAPKIEQVASTILTYVGPAIQTIVTAEAGGAAGTAVSAVLKQAQSDLTAVSGLIYDFGATPSAANIINAVKSNLSALLTASHITNPTSVATITKVTTELNTLATAITAPAA